VGGEREGYMDWSGEASVHPMCRVQCPQLCPDGNQPLNFWSYGPTPASFPQLPTG
jgi:hypothetical protein